MVFFALASRVLAACCSVEVINGAPAGLLLVSFVFTLQYAYSALFQQADGGKRHRSALPAGMTCRS